MELDIGVGIPVLHSDDKAADRGDARKVPVGLLVGTLCVLPMVSELAMRMFSCPSQNGFMSMTSSMQSPPHR